LLKFLDTQKRLGDNSPSRCLAFITLTQHYVFMFFINRKNISQGKSACQYYPVISYCLRCSFAG